MPSANSLSLDNPASSLAWIYLAAAIATSLIYSSFYLPFVAEDALISYRYSDRFLHGQGLTWNSGEFVEGYSNLLWVLLVAIGGFVQPNLILVGWILGLLANAAVLLAIAWTFGRLSTSSILPLTGGLLALALSRSFAIWGIGGLETPLVGALVAWALATTYRVPDSKWGWLCAPLLLGLLAITRPDGLLFAVSIAIALLFRDGLRHAVRRVLTVLIVPFGFAVAQIGFRLSYYGSLVPNTAYAKLAFTSERLWGGAVYLAQGAVVNSVPLLILLTILLFVCYRRQWQSLRETSVFLIPGILWLGYVGIIGGDVFPLHRHWVPALVCIAFALSSLLGSLPPVRPLRAAMFLTITSILYLAVQMLGMDGAHFPPISRYNRMEWECIALGRDLGHAFGAQQPLLAVTAAGCLPYTTRLPSVDMLGLNDSYIAHHRPPDMGRGILAHELGDGAYVLSRKPDLVAFCGPTGLSLSGGLEPCFRGEREMVALADFRRYYRPVFFRAGSGEAAFWTRIEDGRLGIVRTADTIYIPGFLLSTAAGARVVMDTTGRAVTELGNGEAALENVYFPPGTWEISVKTDRAVHVQLETTPRTNSTVLRPNTWSIQSAGGERSFRVFGEHGLLYAISAKRIAE